MAVSDPHVIAEFMNSLEKKLDFLRECYVQDGGFGKLAADSGLEYYRVDIHFTDISDNKDYWWAQFSDHYPVDSADEMSERFEYMGGNSW